MSTITADFTIRETTLYTGIVNIDTDRWQEVLGAPFDADAATAADVAEYVARTGADVDERNADIQGQDWFDVEFEEVEA